MCGIFRGAELHTQQSTDAPPNPRNGLASESLRVPSCCMPAPRLASPFLGQETKRTESTHPSPRRRPQTRLSFVHASHKSGDRIGGVDTPAANAHLASRVFCFSGGLLFFSDFARKKARLAKIVNRPRSKT